MTGTRRRAGALAAGFTFAHPTAPQFRPPDVEGPAGLDVMTSPAPDPERSEAPDVERSEAPDVERSGRRGGGTSSVRDVEAATVPNAPGRARERTPERPDVVTSQPRDGATPSVRKPRTAGARGGQPAGRPDGATPQPRGGKASPAPDVEQPPARPPVAYRPSFTWRMSRTSRGQLADLTEDAQWRLGRYVSRDLVAAALLDVVATDDELRARVIERVRATFDG